MQTSIVRIDWVLLTVLGFLIPKPIEAVDEPYATTEAICSTECGWMNNSAGHSPCLLYARLAAGCTPSGTYDLKGLPSPSKSTNYTRSYPPPKNFKAATPCICNAVAYSLIQACAVCQGGTPMWWSAPPLLEDPTGSAPWWTQHCPPLYTSKNYPWPLSDGTEVPDWATEVGVTVSSGVWDVTAAQNLATSTPVKSSTPTPPPTDHSNAGVIAGSVIGALVFAALLIGLALVHRRYRHTPPSRRYSASATTMFPDLSGIYPASWGRTPKQEPVPFNFTMTYSPVNTTTDRDSAVLVSSPSNRLSRGSSSDAGPPQITIRYDWEPPLPPDPPPPPRQGHPMDHDWGRSLAFWASLGVWAPPQRQSEAGPSTAEANNHLLGRTTY